MCDTPQVWLSASGCLYAACLAQRQLSYYVSPAYRLPVVGYIMPLNGVGLLGSP